MFLKIKNIRKEVNKKSGFKIYKGYDRRCIFTINNNSYVLSNGWCYDVKQLAKKYFKKVKVKIDG